jgi:hypothetical protein
MRPTCYSDDLIWLSATPGAQDDVGDVGGAGRRVNARLRSVQLYREIVAKYSDEVVCAEVVRWVDTLPFHVLSVLVVEVVIDGEQQAMRAHRVEQRPQGAVPGGLGQRRILHRHEIE